HQHPAIAAFVEANPRFAGRFLPGSKPDIKVARQTIIDLRHEGKNLLSQAGDRELTAKEEGRVEELKVQLADAERLLDLLTDELEAERAMAPLPHSSGVRSLALPGPKNSFANVFRGKVHLSNDGFASIEDYFKTLHSGMFDPKLNAAIMREGVGGEGGFLVPSEYGAWLMDGSLENEIVRPRARVEPMTSNEKLVAGFNAQDHTGGSIYGFSGQWIAEGGSISIQQGKLRSITLQARKLATIAEASNELIADGQSFENLLGNAMMSALSWSLDDAFLTGNGSGKPRGVLGDPALIVVAKESGQAADTIVYANVAKMYARMHPALRSEAVWVVAHDTIPQLATMTYSGVDQFIPVLKEEKQAYTLMGRPVLQTEKTPVLGDQGDIIFVNFSQYVIGMRAELGIDKSGHLGFQTDTSHYRLIARVDGTGTWSQAVQPKTGATLSWCVTLAERA
ncbi:MAG: phage major capsid protein, partial [Gammaproteobacteria bacterium]